MYNNIRYGNAIVNLIDIANIRANWHNITGETRYLEDAKEALESALVYINTSMAEIKRREQNKFYD